VEDAKVMKARSELELARIVFRARKENHAIAMKVVDSALAVAYRLAADCDRLRRDFPGCDKD